jgi:hypothetical protein
MAKVGSFYVSSTEDTDTLCEDTFDSGNSIPIDLMKNATVPQDRVTLGSLYMNVDDIAGGATAITVRICADDDGDIVLVGDTTASISTGISTATVGGITIKLDIPIHLFYGTTVYVFWKTNVVASTCQIRNVTIVCVE